jgi:hypothetical protein
MLFQTTLWLFTSSHPPEKNHNVVGETRLSSLPHANVDVDSQVKGGGVITFRKRGGTPPLFTRELRN